MRPALLMEGGSYAHAKKQTESSWNCLGAKQHFDSSRYLGYARGLRAERRSMTKVGGQYERKDGFSRMLTGERTGKPEILESRVLTRAALLNVAYASTIWLRIA
jgi:hypothetical protein